MPSPLRGIIPPLLTPLDSRGRPDTAALRRQVRGLLDAGVHGLWVNGSTGEFFALDAEQRAECVAACVEEAAGAVPVIAHVGAPATAAAIRLGREALAAGADRLAVVAPFYADFTQDELLRHYRQIAAALGRPVVLYHLPKMTKIGLSAESVLSLAADGTAEAIKDSANDMTWYRDLLLQVTDRSLDLRCFTGGGSMTDVGLYLGGHGAMPALANLAPRQCVAMYDAAQEQDWDRMVHIQRGLDRLIAAMRLPGRAATWTPTVAIYKFLLTQRGLLPGDATAPPLQELTDAERRHLSERALPLLTALEPEPAAVGAGPARPGGGDPT